MCPDPKNCSNFNILSFLYKRVELWYFIFLSSNWQVIVFEYYPFYLLFIHYSLNFSNPELALLYFLRNPLLLLLLLVFCCYFLCLLLVCWPFLLYLLLRLICSCVDLAHELCMSFERFAKKLDLIQPPGDVSCVEFSAPSGDTNLGPQTEPDTLPLAQDCVVHL